MEIWYPPTQHKIQCTKISDDISSFWVFLESLANKREIILVVSGYYLIMTLGSDRNYVTSPTQS